MKYLQVKRMSNISKVKDQKAKSKLAKYVRAIGQDLIQQYPKDRQQTIITDIIRIASLDKKDE